MHQAYKQKHAHSYESVITCVYAHTSQVYICTHEMLTFFFSIDPLQSTLQRSRCFGSYMHLVYSEKIYVMCKRATSHTHNVSRFITQSPSNTHTHSHAFTNAHTSQDTHARNSRTQMHTQRTPPSSKHARCMYMWTKAHTLAYTRQIVCTSCMCMASKHAC